MTNEEKLRETFPNTIFIFRKNRNDETAAIMVSDEWLQGDYDQMYKDAEPCEDCVSREAVLDALVTCFDTDSVYDENNGTNYIDYDDAVNEVLDLPPVTPKQKWIPVDYDKYPETYPKAFQEVWITDAYGQVYRKSYDGTRNIKAWMPYVRPEPYKEGESE